MNLDELRKLAGIKLKEEHKGPGFVTNIEQDTVENTDFRRELYTTPHTQLVLMSIEPGSEIGMETHDDLAQFIRVDAGEGYVVMDGVRTPIKDGFAIIIPENTEHNVVNTGSEPLKLYTLYSPPHHENDVVHPTRADAQADDEHWGGPEDTDT